MKLLVVEPGMQYFKERFLRNFTRSGHELFLLVNSAPRIPINPWYCKYVPHTHIFSSDFRDARQAAKSISNQLTARGIRLSGVTTYYEDAVLVVQAIADQLSLTPITTGDPLALRNKSLMRLRFSSVGLPQPRSILCRTLGEAREAVQLVGFPCVVKPNQLTASIGVRKLSIKGEDIDNLLYPAFNEDIPEEDARFAYNIPREVLVEEYVPTYQEVSCEGLVKTGRVQLLAITKKYLSPEPLFEEIGHSTPYQATYETRTMLEEQLNKASLALNLYSTTFHAEFRLRAEEPPVLIELAARLPGGFIPQLVRLSHGVDMLKASLQLALGQEFEVVPRRTAVAAIRFLTDDESARKFAAVADRIRALPFVDDLTIYGSAKVGRQGHVIWIGRDDDELQDHWERISEAR